MRVLVCGGREFDDWRLLNETLLKLTYNEGTGVNLDEVVIIQGGAKGADFLGKVWAIYHIGVTYEDYPADWKTYGKAAGSIRNQQMLDEGKPDLVVAFPGGNGTADMVRRAKKAGVEVIEVT